MRGKAVKVKERRALASPIGQAFDYEAGRITRLDQVDDGAVRPATTEERLAAIKLRLAELDQRLDSKDGC